MASACSTCTSTLGFYQGPNGVARCLNCFHDQGYALVPEDPAVSPEPNTQVEDKAEPGPKNIMTTSGTVQDKAVRGPKEPAKRKGT